MRLTLAFVAAAVVAPVTIAAQLVEPSGTWRTLHTPHFRVHFRPSYRSAAVFAAREIERAYALLARELRPPRGVVDVTLSDDADAANGFATVFPSNRITVFITPPATDHALQNYDDWMRIVTGHELTHLFHLDRTRGPWRVLQTVFGRAPGFFPNGYQPSWVSEGLATYYESRLSHGGRVEGSFHPQLVGADLAAGALRSPWNAVFFTRWADGSTPYAYGSAFVSQIARQTGDSVVPRFVERTAGQWIPFRVGRQWRRAGVAEPLSRAWPQAIRRTLPAGGDGTEETLAGGLWADPAPRLSPDGRRLAYVRNDGRSAPHIVVVQVETWDALASHRVNAVSGFDWLGDTLVVSQYDFVGPRRIRSDLYKWVPGASWRRVTRGARIVEPRAGGGLLAWVTIGAADNAPSVAGVRDGPDATWGEVAPSPDGGWMAATRHSDGAWSLVRWPVATPGAIEVLLRTRAVVSAPLWGPGPAPALYFVWDESGLPQVYRWSATGSEPVTAAPNGARSPAVLGDGTVLYATLRHDGWALARTRAGRSAARAALAPEAFDSAPAVPVRETGYAALPSLQPHFWMPLLLDRRPAGFFLGAATAGSDAIGRYSYVAQGLYAWDRPRVMGGAAFLTHALGNPSIEVAVSSEWRPSRSVSDVSFLDLDAWIGATFETRRWRSAATLHLAAEYEGVRVVADDGRPIPGDDLVGGSVSLGLVHYVSAPLAVSPQNGFEFAVAYRRREAQGSTRWSDELQGRLTLYLPFPSLGAFARPVLALRGAGGVSQGPLSDRFDVGGGSSARFNYLAGRVVGGGGAFFVRGYPG
ncbi:MAG TPA: hypothetical protein VGA20_07340, partial [Gemmatimonadales bacterium]